MLNKSYNQYLIMFLWFSFSLWIQENQAAVQPIMSHESMDQLKVKTVISPEEQKDLLKRLRANMSEEQKRSLTGGKVFAIIEKKEPEKAEIVQEVSPLEQELSKIERRLHSAGSVSNRELEQISSELTGSIRKQFWLSEDQSKGSLHDKINDLTKQVRLFISLMKFEESSQNMLYGQEISDDTINEMQRKLEDIKKEARDQFPEHSSFNGRILKLEQSFKGQQDLLKQDEKVRRGIATVKMSLMSLENVLKKDEIKPEIIEIIRIKLNNMPDPKKLNFPAAQQTIISKRISDLEKLLDIFDYLLTLQAGVKEKNLSLIEAGGIAKGLRNVQKELESLSLPKDLSDNAIKHIAKVNNQLVPKLFEFLDQLASETISTLAQLDDMERQFKTLQQLRKNLDMTKDQKGDIEEKFLYIENLLKDRRALLLGQYEQEKIDREREQIELESKLLNEGRLYERETHAEEKRKAKEQKEREIADLGRKEVERRQKINMLRKEMQKLVPRFDHLIAAWIKKQNEEVASNELYQRSQKLYPGLHAKKHEQKLKNLREQLEKDKDIIKLFLSDVMAIHKDILNLYSTKDINKGGLIELLTEWAEQLEQLNSALLQASKELQQMNLNRKGSISFINRNKYVQEQIKELIEYIRAIRIANDKFIERSTQERDRAKKALKLQGAF